MPEIQFVTTDDDVRLAFQDFGSGPPVVVIGPLMSHLEGAWEHELERRRWEYMGQYVRVLTFDHRGAGLSDRTDALPTLEARLGDVEVVMDAAGLDRASAVGYTEGTLVAMAFAARHPDRVERLVVANCDWRIGTELSALAESMNPDPAAPWLLRSNEERNRTGSDHGTAGDTEFFIDRIPSVVDHPDFLQWLPRYLRLMGSRDALIRQMSSLDAIELAGIPEAVTVPTLITHTTGNRTVHVGYARALDEAIPDSTLVEFEGADYEFWLGANWREILDCHLSFLLGREIDAPVERRLAVIVFTDLVDSTAHSMAAGDRHWRQRLDTHDRICDRVVSTHGGSIVKSTGDGVMATFATPSEAVIAAATLRDELADAGLSIRGGIHAGEVEIREDDISGAVVNLAARVQQAAEDGEIYVTKAIRDMLLGSDDRFDDAGTHSLKGFEGSWLLFRIAPSSPRLP